MSAVEEALAGRVPPSVAVMRMLLSGMPAAAVRAEVARSVREEDGPAGRELRRLADDVPALKIMERLVAAGADHAPALSAEEGIASARAMFDRLVQVSPAASVAAYSLGDEARLAAATEEVVAWLEGSGLLAGRPSVLDLGCGIGRFCRALAPRAARIAGVEVSGGMAAEARARCAGLPNVIIVQVPGHGLEALRDDAFDLVLAADVFPYLVGAGGGLAAHHLSEAARVLRPGGALAILNFSYRGGDADRRDLPSLARGAGLVVAHADPAPFRSWDAAAWVLRHAVDT